MASASKNLSLFESKIPSAKEMVFGIVVSEWNSEVTSKLLKGAVDFLIKQGADKENIIIKHVPGTFELTLASQWMMSYTEVDAVIALGCVVQGETRHFDFICHGVTEGLNRVAIDSEQPVIFGVLTVENQQQALDRAGGKHGNKGVEAAATAIKMVALHYDFLEEYDDISDDDDIFNYDDDL